MQLTMEELKSLLETKSNRGASPHPYAIGENYFIRTVTHHYTGKLVAVFDQELLLEGAAWIADDGRFADAVAKGTFNEIEPYPNDVKLIVGRGSVIDACQIGYPLPRSQK